MADFDSATLSSTATSAPATGQRPASRKALEIRPTFCPTEVESPFDTTEWELRTAAITTPTALSMSWVASPIGPRT